MDGDKAMQCAVELLQMSLKSLNEHFPPTLQDDDLARFTNATSIMIPSEFIEWLKLCNGISVGADGLFGIYAARSFLDIEHLLSELPTDWKKCGWIPVSSDGCGNYYVMPTRHDYGSGYPVVFFDMIRSQEEPQFIVASDIWHFVCGYLEAEVIGYTGWPFEKETVVAFDPKIMTFHGVRLPWDT